MEEKFNDGCFVWDDRRPHDCAALLKQFLRYTLPLYTNWSLMSATVRTVSFRIVYLSSIEGVIQEHDLHVGRSRVQTPARTLSFLSRKCSLCNDICKQLDFLVFPDKDDILCRVGPVSQHFVPTNLWDVKEPTHC